MKKIVIGVLLCFICSGCTIFSVPQSKKNIITNEALDQEFYQDRYILILKSTMDYNEAVRFATEASKILSLNFDNEYKVYSKKDGIYFSQELPDESYKGKYSPRRYSEEFISLENSSEYGKEFTSGYIIVVAGIYDNKETSDKALNKIKLNYKDAYVKKTNMWMGCIH